MRTSKASNYHLAVAVAIGLLAGCSASGPQMAANPLGPNGAIQSTHGQIALNHRLNSILALQRGIVPSHRAPTPSFFNRDAKGKALIFVSDASHNAVDIYLQRGKNKMVGQVTGFTYVEGIATDRKGNLYVATQPDSPQIFVYAPPYTGAPKLTLDDSGYYPNAVAISRRGIVGVANECNVPSCGAGTGTVTFYAKDSSEPCATVTTDPAKFSYLAYGAAFDHDGNFYFDGEGASVSSVVGEVSGGCKAKKARLLTTANTIMFAQGIQVDKANRIAIVDTSSALIDTYDNPKRGSLGNPISMTLLTGSSDPVTVAFLASGSALYVADGTDDVANEYIYPAGGMLTNTISVGGIALGVAVTPPLVP